MHSFQPASPLRILGPHASHGGNADFFDMQGVQLPVDVLPFILFFRSTDVRTMQRLDELCPFRPGLAAVTRVRPVSTLAPGECYAVLVNDRFERRQLNPFSLDGRASASSGS